MVQGQAFSEEEAQQMAVVVHEKVGFLLRRVAQVVLLEPSEAERLA